MSCSGFRHVGKKLQVDVLSLCFCFQEQQQHTLTRQRKNGTPRGAGFLSLPAGRRSRGNAGGHPAVGWGKGVRATATRGRLAPEPAEKVTPRSVRCGWWPGTKWKGISAPSSVGYEQMYREYQERGCFPWSTLQAQKQVEITLCGEESTAGRVGLTRDRRRAKVILSPVVKPHIGVANGFEKNL